MKAIGVIGYHHTGKTTVVEALTRLLTGKGYRVSTIKDIHSEAYHADKEGSNTHRHMVAGAHQVFAKGLYDSALIFDKALSLTEVIPHLDCDFLILEGLKAAAMPKILCAESIEQLEELYDDTVIAISGKLANAKTGWEEPAIYDIYTQAEALLQLVLDRAFDLLPNSDPECCSACGMTCYQMCAAILRGEKQRTDCVSDSARQIRLSINDREIPLVPFVQKLLTDNIKAFIGNLKGADPDGRIKIEIK